MGKVYYLHTLNGKPAHYQPGRQIVFSVLYGRATPLATSLRQIRREQAASRKWRAENGHTHSLKQGYRRVEAPE